MQPQANEQGFSLVEVIIALAIMLVGLLAMVAAITGGIVRNQEGAQQLMARHHATSTLESIVSARDIKRLGFKAIKNRASCPGNGTVLTEDIFPIGKLAIYAQAGDDKIIATCDDTGSTETDLSREIIITDICDPDRPSPNCVQAIDGVNPGTNEVMMRQITVNVYYKTSLAERLISMSTVVTNYVVE